MKENYNIVRTMPDGQRVVVCVSEKVNDARKVIERLSEYWPGNYIIVPSNFGKR